VITHAPLAPPPGVEPTLTRRKALWILMALGKTLSFRNLTCEWDGETFGWYADVRDTLTGDEGWVVMSDHWPEPDLTWCDG
jgi:hypothetical protein